MKNEDLRNTATVDGDTVALAIKEGPDTASPYKKPGICIILRKHGLSCKSAGKDSK